MEGNGVVIICRYLCKQHIQLTVVGACTKYGAHVIKIKLYCLCVEVCAVIELDALTQLECVCQAVLRGTPFGGKTGHIFAVLVLYKRLIEIVCIVGSLIYHHRLTKAH